MINKIFQGLEENTERLQRFIWAGEYTGYPDWWTMSQLIREIGEGLTNLRRQRRRRLSRVSQPFERGE